MPLSNDDDLRDDASGTTVKMPLIAEVLDVSTVKRETGRVLVHKTVHTEERIVDEPQIVEAVEVRRVPVGRVVDAPVATRTEGDVTIVPVYEERLIVTRQLVLKEELHITTRRTEERNPQRIELRSEEVSIERLAPADAAATAHQPPSAAQRSGGEAG